MTELSAKEGLKLLHEEYPSMMLIVELYERTLKPEGDKERLTTGEFLASCLSEVEWSTVEKLTDALLVAYPSGTLILFSDLYHAIVKNFESTINPLREALLVERKDSTGRDTSENSENSQTE